MANSPKNRRLLIIEAARSEFAEHGYAGARVARIAATAGVNKQLIFYYFKSKEGLFDALTEGALERLELAIARESGSSREHFRNAFQALFEGLEQSPELTRLLFFGNREPHRTEALDRLGTMLGRRVADGQGLGYFRDDVDTDFVARQIVSVLLAYFALRDPLFERADHGRDKWLREIGSLLTDWLTW